MAQFVGFTVAALMLAKINAAYIVSSTPSNKEVAEDLLKDLTSVIETSVKDSVESILTLKEDSVEFSEKIVAIAVSTLKKNFTETFEKVDQIRKEAQSKGLNVSKCIDSNKEGLLQLSRICSEGVKMCVALVNMERDSLSNGSIAIIEDNFSIVRNYRDKLVKCNSSEPCLNQFMEDVKDAMDIIPSRIGLEMKRIIESMNSISFYLAFYLTGEEDKTSDEVAEILEKVYECC